jgi:SAM-dependent methyltransferase
MQHASDGLPFELDPQDYDALINWQRRLANEESFYRTVFGQVGAASVLDAACGTGHHAGMFACWGLRVEAADVSAAMVAYCRDRHGESETLRWVQRSFTEPVARPGTFDAAICVGNSLAVADDLETVGRVVGNMLGALRPGGVCIVHVLNLQHIREGPTLWQKCQHVRRGGADHILLKGIHRVGMRGHIDFIRLMLSGGELTSEFHTTQLLGITADDLRAAAMASSAQGIRFFGDYKMTPFDAEASTDLILVCYRA